MGVAVDEVNNEIIVANTATTRSSCSRAAPAAPCRQARHRGALTGVKGPMGVAIAKRRNLRANFGDHTAAGIPAARRRQRPPRRIIRNAPAGGRRAASQSVLGRLRTKRGEILVPN